MRHHLSKWKDEHFHIAKALWLEGRSASEIARTLAAPPFNREGTTRSSVISVLRRAGVTKERAKSSPSVRGGSQKFKSRGGTVSTTNLPDKARVKLGLPPVTGIKPIIATKAGDVASVSIVSDLQSNQCRWPVGDPGAHGFGFCGAVAADGKPYCPHHAERAIDRKATNTAKAEEARKTWAA